MKVRETHYTATVYYSAIAAVILFSFFSFSYAYYPFFNSDSALSVLMSYDYHFPRDLYCWGQNRGGTLEMMIAHIFISNFHTSPLMTASIIHYLLLVAGLVASFHFVHQPFHRLALAILWFFPSYFFLETLLYQFSIQFSLFMIAIYFLGKAIDSEKRKSLLLSLSLLFMIMNIWVLDLGLIPVLFLAAYLFYKKLAARKGMLPVPDGFNKLFNKKNLILTVFGIAAGACFIAYAKINASGLKYFTGSLLNNFGGISGVVISIFKSFATSILLFRRKPMESIYVCAAIFFIILFVIESRKNKKSGQLFFSPLFLGTSLLWTVLLLFLKQVEINLVPARYFAGAFLSFSIFAMMKLDSLNSKNLLLRISLVMVMACTVLSSLYETYIPKRLPPILNNFSSLDLYKPVGIIGSYWNSYLFSAMDPANIKATPYEGDNVRNSDLAYSTLAQPTLLLIQNEWLEDFPDTISQFGTPLMKKGNPFLLGTYISWDEVNPVIACEYMKRP